MFRSLSLRNFARGLRLAILTTITMHWTALPPSAYGDVVIDTVPVGNAGNAGEPFSPGRLAGGVGYSYRMGKYEVTAGQYTAFLNAVAQADTFGLYNEQMWTHEQGCMIQRQGEPGSYAYAVAPEWANRPVNYVSWGDSARFANWMHNGQPAGPQGPATTERGSYRLDGATTDRSLEFVTRESGATWSIPTDDEWYKSAYHMNNGVTADFWSYPTGSDVVPSNVLAVPDPGNSANFSTLFGGFTIGAPYFRTEVGAFSNSASPYGTFDQGGNVSEYTETRVHFWLFGRRGGAFESGYLVDGLDLSSGSLDYGPFLPPSPVIYESAVTGFRLSLVPEPESLLMLAIGCLVAVYRPCART